MASVAKSKPSQREHLVHKQVDVNDHGEPLDRWCWPHSEAMNGAEIKLFLGRVNALQRYTDNAESVADQLMRRDRDPFDDRKICLACKNLNGDYCKQRYASKAKNFQPVKTVLWRCDYFQAK